MTRSNKNFQTRTAEPSRRKTQSEQTRAKSTTRLECDNNISKTLQWQTLLWALGTHPMLVTLYTTPLNCRHKESMHSIFGSIYNLLYFNPSTLSSRRVYWMMTQTHATVRLNEMNFHNIADIPMCLLVISLCFTTIGNVSVPFLWSLVLHEEFNDHHIYRKSSTVLPKWRRLQRIAAYKLLAW